MSVIEVLNMIYTFVPQEIVLIILGGITLFILLEIEERKNNILNGKTKNKKIQR